MYIDNSIKNKILFANRFTPQLNSRKFVNTLFGYFKDEAPNAVNLLQLNRCKLEQFAIVQDYINCHGQLRTIPFQELQMVALTIFRADSISGYMTNTKGENMVYLYSGDLWEVSLIYWRGEFRFIAPAVIVCNPQNEFSGRLRFTLVEGEAEYA